MQNHLPSRIGQSLVLLFLLIAGIGLLSSSSQTIKWEQNYGGGGYDRGRAIDKTSDGGYIVTGCSDSAHIDVSNNNGGRDYWVVKLNDTGKIVWENNYGGSDQDEPYDIKQTKDGGYIVVGETASSDQDVANNWGIRDYWVLKLDPNGNIDWKQTYGGTSRDGARSVIQTADSGYIVAGFSGSDDVDVPANYGNNDVWVVKLSSTGTIDWSQNYGGSSLDGANVIQQLSDQKYIIGGYSYSSDSNVTSNYGSSDYWLLTIDTGGTLLSEHNYGGSDLDKIKAIQETDDGQWMIGGFTASNDSDVTANYGFRDYWIVKSDTSGNIIWEKNYGGSDFDMCRNLKLKEDKSFIASGYTSSNDSDITNYRGGGDIWLIKADSTGTLKRQRSLGGIEYDATRYHSLSLSSDGSYAVAGISASDSIDASNNYGNSDYWVVELCNKTTNSISVTSCDQYTSPSGQHTWSSSGIYYDTLTNRAGCDSILTINLTINNSTDSTFSVTSCDSYNWQGQTYNKSGTYYDTTSNNVGCDSMMTLKLTIDSIATTAVQKSQDTLQAEAQSVNYQWLDCDNGSAAISGATNRTFVPTESGNYAVKLTNNSCVDTSQCHNITIDGVKSSLKSSAFKVYPNPTSDQFTLEGNHHFKNLTIEILNNKGQLIRRRRIENRKRVTLSLDNQPQGIYLIKLNKGQKQRYFKLHKINR